MEELNHYVWPRGRCYLGLNAVPPALPSGLGSSTSCRSNLGASMFNGFWFAIGLLATSPKAGTIVAKIARSDQAYVTTRQLHSRLLSSSYRDYQFWRFEVGRHSMMGLCSTRQRRSNPGAFCQPPCEQMIQSTLCFIVRRDRRRHQARSKRGRRDFNNSKIEEHS